MRSKLHLRVGICVMLLFAAVSLVMSRQLWARTADTPAPTPYLTSFGYAPAIFGALAGPTALATSPPPTATPWATPTLDLTDPSPTGMAIATGTGAATATVGATATMTATSTASATATPGIVPTPAAGQLQVLPNLSTWTDDTGCLTIRGEVLNGSASALRSIRVPAQLLNKKGKVIQTEEALTLLNHLGPGEKTCFSVSIVPHPRWQTVTFGEITYQIDAAPVAGLELSNITQELDTVLGWYFVGGQVRNASSYNYDLLRLVATLYNSAGEVIGCDFGYTYGNDLLSGADDSFELLFADRDYADAADLHLQAEGDHR